MQAISTHRTIPGSVPLVPRARILLVDEDPRDRDHYRRMLQDSGFDVKTCQDFAQSEHLLDTADFDCLLVSQGGPEFKGRTVLEYAVARDRYRPVVIVSRYHDVGCYLDAMHLGAVDYLEKPLSAVEIVRAVTTHLQPRNAAA